MGLGCGRPIPGVYADITQGLCFIHAATKCIQGDKYEKYYYYPQCDDWLDTLVARYVFMYQLQWVLEQYGLGLAKCNYYKNIKYIIFFF